MDTDEMVRMAKEREGWHTSIHAHGGILHCYLLSGNHSVARFDVADNLNFTAHAPRTILALTDEAARLQERLAEVAQQAQQRSNEHHDLAVEYLEDGKPEMAQSSRTLASCYAKVAEWLTRPSPDQP